MSGFFLRVYCLTKNIALSYTDNYDGSGAAELSLFQKPTCGKIIVIIYF